jgi:hypothetical protein
VSTDFILLISPSIKFHRNPFDNSQVVAYRYDEPMWHSFATSDCECAKKKVKRGQSLNFNKGLDVAA